MAKSLQTICRDVTRLFKSCWIIMWSSNLLQLFQFSTKQAHSSFSLPFDWHVSSYHNWPLRSANTATIVTSPWPPTNLQSTKMCPIASRLFFTLNWNSSLSYFAHGWSTIFQNSLDFQLVILFEPTGLKLFGNAPLRFIEMQMKNLPKLPRMYSFDY